MSAPAGRSVLVTGGAGFLGSHLVEELVRRGDRVSVIDNFSTGFESNLSSVSGRVDLCRLDLRKDDARPMLERLRPEAIFHVAANAYVPTSVEDPRSDFENNALSTFNLLEAVRQAARETPLLHTSSVAVYGEGVRMPIREEDPTNPVSPYGASKLAAERYVAVYAKVFGLKTANLRLFPIYGPRLRKQVIYDLMRKVRDNPRELPIYGDGTQVRDFNYVGNVVEALMLVAGKGALEGEVYNVAAEHPVTIRRLAEMICDRMGASPRFLFSGDVRPGDAQRWVADTTRLKGLGYSPRVGFAEGLAETVAWFRQEPGSPKTP